MSVRRGSMGSMKFQGDIASGTESVPRGPAQLVADQINVAMVAPADNGGHSRYTHELLSALSRVGQGQDVRVSLVTTRDLAPWYRTSSYDIHDILPPLRPREEFRNTLHWAVSRAAYYARCEEDLLRWARRNADCGGLHFQDYTPLLVHRHFRSLKSRGKRVFITVHNVYPHSYDPGLPKALQDSWTKVARRQCDALLVHSESLRDDLSNSLGKGHPPIFVTPHGVWNSTADPLPDEERIQKRRLLFFGVIRPNKGLHVLLRAMKRLPDCTLVVAGASDDARYQKQVRVLIDQLPTGRVEYIDRFVGDDEIPGLFLNSSVVVLPYTSFAAQSGVLHDALAYRLPVVATDVGALGESVRRWGIGRVVPPDNDGALAEGIRALLDPQLNQEASEASAKVREEFSWTRTAETTIAAYRSVWEKTETGGR